MIFKTITDETTLSGQRIVGALQARKIAQQQAAAQLEIDIACLKDYQVACQNGTVTTEQFDTIMHKASASAVEYSAKIKAGVGTAQSYANAQRATNSALQEVSIGAGIASKAVKLFSATLNMIAFTAIIQGVSWLIGKVDEWIVTAKEAKESANAFKESLSTFFSETQSNLKTISSLSDRFDELSKNVDNTGKKIGGTEEEYAEFLDICQQVGQIMPELITGYTNEGEAIITLQGKVDSLTDSYKEAIKAKAALFISNGDEEGNTINSFFKDYNNFINGDQGFLGLKLSPLSSQHKPEEFENYYGYNEISSWLSDVAELSLDDLQNKIKTLSGSVQATYLRSVLEDSDYDINNITAENYNAIHDVLNNKLIILEKELSDRVQNIRSAFQSMLYADSDYWHIDDENVIAAINSLYSSIDNEFIKQNNLFDQNALQTFESNFISLFNNDDIKQAMVDFYTPIAADDSVNDYTEKVKNALETIQAYCKENGIEIPIEISDNDTIDTAKRLQNSLRQITDDHGISDREEYATLSEYTKKFTQAQAEMWLEVTLGAQNATEAVQMYEKALESASDKPINISEWFESHKDQIDTFQSNLKTLGDALTSIRSGSFENSDLTDLLQEFPELADKSDDLESALVELINNSLKVLYDTLGEEVPDGLKVSLQELADIASGTAMHLSDAFSSIHDSWDILQDFKDTMEAGFDDNITDSLLQSVRGLSGELETLVAGYYSGIVTAEELYKALTEHYENDLHNYSEALIKKNDLNTDFYNAVGMASEEVVNQFMDDYDVGLENCKTYNQAKLEIEKQTLGQISALWSQYYDAQSQTLKMSMSEIEARATHGGTDAAAFLEQYKLIENYEAAMEALNNITYDGIRSNFESISSKLNVNSSSSSSSGATSEFEETIDFFERRVEELDNALSRLDSTMDNLSGSFSKNNLIDAELGINEEKFNNYTDALAMYTQKANEALSKLPSDIAAKVKDGAVALTDFIGDGNKDVVEAIKEYESWADKISDCKQELAELKTAIRQLELEKFNNIMSDFESQFNLRDDSKDLISKQIDLLKEAGELIGESFYTAQIDQSKKQLELLENEKAQLVNKMSSAIGSGRVNCCPLLQ